ncbi:ImmA/IrrE family metallo-endopeptidase [Clavibacter michiganensis]|uniref:ImmA/IrrE family metallo-endopeptidase n=1 Tax=Clavibacter michiganensis TaxID=28447 RepID=UPI0026DCE99E|nr:ImmA/IrrE family metallo-endopeptidase [Clavibacter michiganensis]MDO4144000.1 ImmA/IrrE family metallo-endopeptidase [Clavibacter michiganensis]
MSVRIPVSAEVLRWAVERAGWGEDTVNGRFPRFEQWLVADPAPTLKQLQTFAHAAHVPFGYLMLQTPPTEPVPIPDFRTRGNARREDLSPDLRDTIYMCQRRQAWFRDFALAHGLEEVPLVGFASIGDPVEPVAERIRTAIGFGMDRRSAFRSWEAAFRQLIDLIEDAGVLVSVNGVVGSDTHRVLDPDEFGGFALVDDHAPLIFVNAADTKAAQIFTIVHELAHIAAGESALSDAGVDRPDHDEHERWCNQVAAEVLVPRATLPAAFAGAADAAELQRLAALYRVSTLVVLRRLHDTQLIGWDEYRVRYRDELARVQEFARKAKDGNSGGNFYKTQPLRLGRRFARAVVTDARGGGTTYGEAYRLLGTAKPETFGKLADELGVA